MELTTADQYYLKASCSYPFDLESTIENLNYALSYDYEHASSNCLLGRIYMYHLKDYKKAAKCFYNSLLGNIDFPDTYKYYSLLRIWEGEYDRASIIITKGLSIVGMDKSILLMHKAIIHEWKGEFKAAKKILKQAKFLSIDTERINSINANLSRIKKKQKDS